jgi:hypothetical protein
MFLFVMESTNTHHVVVHQGQVQFRHSFRAGQIVRDELGGHVVVVLLKKAGHAQIGQGHAPVLQRHIETHRNTSHRTHHIETHHIETHHIETHHIGHITSKHITSNTSHRTTHRTHHIETHHIETTHRTHHIETTHRTTVSIDISHGSVTSNKHIKKKKML